MFVSDRGGSARAPQVGGLVGASRVGGGRGGEAQRRPRAAARGAYARRRERRRRRRRRGGGAVARALHRSARFCARGRSGFTRTAPTTELAAAPPARRSLRV